MQESGEPMEFGIFDFSKVFSRAFGEGVMGQRGLEWKVGDVVTDLPMTKILLHYCRRFLGDLSGRLDNNKELKEVKSQNGNKGNCREPRFI